jgi:hypothetical protein
MSRFIVQQSGSYLLWAKAPTGHEIQILIDGADVGIARESYVGPWSRRDIDAERDLAEGVVVTTMPEDARLTVRSLPGMATVYDSHGGDCTSGPG